MGTHPIFESDFDCLTEALKTPHRHHGYDGADNRPGEGLHEGCRSFCPSLNKARQEGISEDCLCYCRRFSDHGIHWLLRQAHPYPDQQHYCRLRVTKRATITPFVLPCNLCPSSNL